MVGKKKKNKKESKETNQISIEDLLGDLRLLRGGTPEGYLELETYPLNPPFAYATIVQSKETAEYLYNVDELPLTKEEREAFKRLRNIMGYELKEIAEDILDAPYTTVKRRWADAKKLLYRELVGE